MSHEQIAQDYFQHHLSIIRRRQSYEKAGIRANLRLSAPHYQYLPERIKTYVSFLRDQCDGQLSITAPAANDVAIPVIETEVDVKIRVLSVSGVGELNRQVSASLLGYWATLETYEGLVYSYLHAFMSDEDQTRAVVLVRRAIWNDVFGKLEPFADAGDDVYQSKLEELIEVVKATNTHKLLTL